MRIELQRDRSAAEPLTRLTLDTGDTSLPLSLFAALLGHQWPTAAEVRGKLPVVWQHGNWQAQFVGQLRGIQLSDLSPNWMSYDAQGSATLNVDSCRFDRQGLQAIQGWLNVDEVVLPQELLRSLIQLELLAPGPAFGGRDPQQPIALPQLGVSFALSEMGLVCRGVPDEAGLCVAAAIDDGPVLLSDGSVRMEYLICALVPDNVPNVYQARARLMDRLPATLPRLPRL